MGKLARDYGGAAGYKPGRVDICPTAMESTAVWLLWCCNHLDASAHLDHCTSVVLLHCFETAWCIITDVDGTPDILPKLPAP